MLYLNPPYFLIDGVSVFPDHADPLQFYYLPMMPHLTMTKDADGHSVPQLQLIEYTGAAGTGGFLNFDVNIGIAPDQLSSVAQQLKQQARLDGDPRLSPVTFVDGTVRLLVLGAESPDPAAPASSGVPAATTTPGGPRFVIKIENAAKPALFGDNQATFSVQLDQYGATVLAAALQGEMAPVAVVYSLEFVALRPAFNVKLTVDWDRVHKFVEDQFSGGFLFFSSEVDKAVDKLIESRVISIEVDTFVADGDGGKTVADDKDRAVAQVYDMIKDTFFQPSMPPQAGSGNAVGTAREIAQLIGGGGGAMCSRKQVDLTQIDKKSLDVNISERTAVQRTIYPQGHIAGLFDVLRSGGIDIERFIIRVDTDDPYFARRTLAISTNADFAADSIASIDVDLDYGGVIKSVKLIAGSAAGAVDWSSRLENGAMVRPVNYSYTVNFSGGIDATQRPTKLVSEQKQAIGDNLTIDPRDDLYAITVIPVRADNLPFDRYPNVEVECRYVDPVDGLTQQASALLTAQSNELTWPIFMRDRTRRTFEYRLTFALGSGGTRTTPWISSDEGKIDIQDPMPSKVELQIEPFVDWTSISQILLYVAYPQKQNPLAHQSYLITAQTLVPLLFEAERPDGAPATIYYDIHMIGPGGHQWVVPGSSTTDASLTITDGMLGHQVITIAPEAVDFTAKQIEEIDVALRYADPANSIDQSDSFVISHPDDSREFAFDYRNPTIHAEYSADIKLGNGQTKHIDWTPAASTMITIPLSQID